MIKYYIGIDLGTTNSSIASFDGEHVRIFKSPEQNDVTPSAIVIDKRGNKYVGKRAYDIAPIYPDNSALLFKRLMGSSTKIKFSYIKEEKTPEECSAEILKVLFGYLPEEVKTSEELGTVITIPAAFNQMQKDATVKAANMAGIGKIALMQEPVAAVMSVMRNDKTEGIFLIYDLGGGTLDIAIAESNNSRVSLLANGGIQMCGGRDIDRAIFDNIVKPWLMKEFKLPQNLNASNKYKRLIRLAYWAVERAKIELSSREETNIILNELEASLRDESDEEIYIDIPLTRKDIEPFIDERVKESVEAIEETLEKASLTAKDIEKIIFIGGPTNYKPLRDKICDRIGIIGSNDLNPMTAVAEGAAIFAESIDWKSNDNSRKSSKNKITSQLGSIKLSFAYISRTPELKARVKVQIEGSIIDGCEFQIDSLDTGWSSGKLKLTNNASLFVNLSKSGDNNFKAFVFDPYGRLVNIPNSILTITRTAAVIDSITASHSIGVAVKDDNANGTRLEWLIKAGDTLPKKGNAHFKAAETLKAGSNSSLNFKLFEGEISDPITDNRNIGTLKIRGNDIDSNINAGADLICEYEMLDSGNIILNVSIPSIGTSIDSDRNFYSPQEGQIDYSTSTEKVISDTEKLSDRIEFIEDKGIKDSNIIDIRDKINKIKNLVSESDDIEKNQEAQERLLEAKKLLAKIKKKHIKEVREIDLADMSDFFDRRVRPYAKKSEIESFEALRRSAKRDIERNNRNFENSIEEIRYLNFDVLIRQDWYVIDRFKYAANTHYNYSDKSVYKLLIIRGENMIRANDIDGLRKVLFELAKIRIVDDNDYLLLDEINIIKS